MRLQRLTQLERDKLVEEYRGALKTIEYLRSVLGSEALVRKIIRMNWSEIKEKYQDERRTKIVTRSGTDARRLDRRRRSRGDDFACRHIKRNAVTLYRAQRRGGKGRLPWASRKRISFETLFTASTHDSLLFFTDAGKVYWLKVHEIPEASRAAKGKALVNLLALSRTRKSQPRCR